MAGPGRLLVVSNRLPVSLVRQGTEWQTARSAGGLATAMDPILKRAGGVWIGWSGARESEPPEALELLRQEQGCIAVDLPADLAE
jgi:trehalose-6-phosphate synthase